MDCDRPTLCRQIGEDKWNYGMYVLQTYRLDSFVIETVRSWKFIITRKGNTYLKQIFYKGVLMNGWTCEKKKLKFNYYSFGQSWIIFNKDDFRGRIPTGRDTIAWIDCKFRLGQHSQFAHALCNSNYMVASFASQDSKYTLDERSSLYDQTSATYTDGLQIELMELCDCSAIEQRICV